MPILKILPDAISNTSSYVFGNVTTTSITANGVNLGTAVAQAFLLANNAAKSTTSDTAPANPNVGDIWFDTITSITFRYNNDGVSNNWIDISGPQNAGYIYQSYSITPNTTSINETTGNTVIYTVATTNTADNTTLYWTNSGTTVAADFSDSVSNGSVTIINNSGTVTRSLVGDLTTEGSETIILSLRTGSNTGPVVAVASSVTVGDTSTTPFTVGYLLVAGGGGGGAYVGGGGGAGGYLTGNTTSLSLGVPYTITIGAGGAGGILNNPGDPGSNGANTTLGAILTSIGGGGGGGYYGGQKVGGSGGGAANLGSFPGAPLGAAGIAGQGFRGGDVGASASYTGGGGGAGAVGGTSISNRSGDGGAGLQWFNGNYYSGGGGGGTWVGDGVYTSGGIGGGGTGSKFESGVAGTVNTGGGGGGSANFYVGADGGSGIAILRYLGTPVATGGTITQSGGYTYHTFTSSNTFTLN
jgi:hypothetical protein